MRRWHTSMSKIPSCRADASYRFTIVNRSEVIEAGHGVHASTRLSANGNSINVVWFTALVRTVSG
jgi:hypothetical protein